jgi:hypothetical protein
MSKYTFQLLAFPGQVYLLPIPGGLDQIATVEAKEENTQLT